jgi:death-on-curing protein
MKYLTIDQVLAIHLREIARFGGDPGIRDRGLVESAVAQPRSIFGGQSLYPTMDEEAVALAFSLIKNHPFVDGNKRVGAAALLMFLGRNGYTLRASVDEMESAVMKVAAGGLDRAGFVAWVRVRRVRKAKR